MGDLGIALGGPSIRGDSDLVPHATTPLCNELTEKTHVIQDHWPLFTPALLALAEDEDSNVRSRGLDILALFISKCPGRILQTTGLASIFEQVAFPALLHLPGITPEVESVQLLDPAYRVLLNLVDSCRDPKDPHRRRLLDKILRDGIFEGYHHASQHVLVARTLLQYMASAVNSLGIYSVKHLQVPCYFIPEAWPID